MAGYDGRRTTCTSAINFVCGAIYVFGVSNMIYINPSFNVPANTPVTITLSDVPNPDYVLNSNSYQIDGF